MTTVAQPLPPAPSHPIRRWPIMVSLVFALIPVQLDTLVAATAMPTIAGDLGGFDRLAWIATSYLLAMAIGTATSGRLGDLFGRRRLLIVAILVFGAGSLWAGLSSGMTELIAARAVQGLGAGMTFTSLLAAVGDIAPPEQRARYAGVFGAVAPFSMIVGPWVGGLITDHLGWRWIFLLNLPLVAVSLIGVLVLLRLPRSGATGRVDVAGLGLLSLASAGIVLAASWGGHQYPWLSWQVLGAAAVAAAAVAGLIVVERRATHPVLPLGLFRRRPVLMSFLVLMLGTGSVMTAAINYLPVFLQVVQGHSASNSGLLLLPMLLPAIGVALVIGEWTSRGARFRPVMIGGTALLALSAVLLATMDAGTPGWLTAVYMAVGGIGVGLLFQTPMVLVQNSAPQAELGAATGTASFLRTIGGAAAVGALGSLFAAAFTSHLAAVPSAAGVSPGALEPGSLQALSPQAQTAVLHAAVSANSAVFWAAAALAVLALLAALWLPRPRTGPADRHAAVDARPTADLGGPGADQEQRTAAMVDADPIGPASEEMA